MPLPLDSHPTILGCLRHYTQAQPDARAYTFVADGEADDRLLTYQELDERSTRLAWHLCGQAPAGSAAVLLFPSGLEFIVAFFACLKAGMVAVPANLARNTQHYARLQVIMQDCGARFVLTTPQLRKTVQAGLAGPEHTEAAAAIVVEADAEVGAGCIASTREPQPHDIAFLQYTSGSTGTPKGVMVTHAQLMANERAIQRSARLPEHLEGAGWLPQFHDMGLIGATLQPVALGGHYVFMSPLHFVQRPLRWLEMISRFGSEASAAPNFALDLCVKTLDQGGHAGRQPIDLRSLKTIFCGAEPVNAQTVRRFVERFGPAGLANNVIRPCYGLAECTLLVSGGDAHEAPPVLRLDRQAFAQGQVQASGAEDGLSSVCCGSVPEHHEVAIVDPAAKQRVEDGRVGEIWVSGPSVASGYWNRAEATTETFHASVGDGTGPFMRTGDLGFMHAGAVFVTGRVKELMIVRGRNHYPADIEQTIAEALGADWLGAVAVFSVEAGGTERVIAAMELGRRQRAHDLDGLSRCLARARQYVAHAHDLQLADLVVIGHACIPRTSSGKTQRLRCAELYQQGDMQCLWRQLQQATLAQTTRAPVAAAVP